MTPFEIYNLIFWLTLVAILVPITMLLRTFKAQPPAYRWLTYLLMFSFLCEIVNQIQSYTIGFSLNYISGLYSTFVSIFWSGFFYQVIDSRKLKIPLITINILHITFSLANILFIQKETINSYSSISEHILMLGLSIVYFFKLLKELPSERIDRVGIFWVISSMFIFNAAKAILWTFTHYLILHNDNLIVFMDIHNTMSIASSLIIGYGVSLHNQTLRQHTLS